MLLNASFLGAPDLYACSYHYVFVIDADGTVAYRGGVNLAILEIVLEDAVNRLNGVPVQDVPGAAALLGANFPNPFNPSTRIPFEVPVDRDGAQTRLEVLDLRGRLVRTLVAGAMPAGSHVAVFDGRNDRGDFLPSGGYLARLRVGDASQSRVMSLIK